MTFANTNIIIRLQSREAETSIQRNSKGKREGGKYISYNKKGNNPKKMGRPTTDPRVINLKIRLSNTENIILEEIVKRTGRTKTDIITRGIALVYKELNK